VTPLEAKARTLVIAALLELDAKWRLGTANAAFGDPRTIGLLRGLTAPHIHESDVAFVRELIEDGRLVVALAGRMSDA